MESNRNINDRSMKRVMPDPRGTCMTGLYSPDVCLCLVLLMLTIAEMRCTDVFQMYSGSRTGENTSYTTLLCDNILYNTNKLYRPVDNPVTRIEKVKYGFDCMNMVHNVKYIHRELHILDRCNDPLYTDGWGFLSYTTHPTGFVGQVIDYLHYILQILTLDELPVTGSDTGISRLDGATEPILPGLDNPHQHNDMKQCSQVWSGISVSMHMRERANIIAESEWCPCFNYVGFHVLQCNTYVMSRRGCKLRSVCSMVELYIEIYPVSGNLLFRYLLMHNQAVIYNNEWYNIPYLVLKYNACVRSGGTRKPRRSCNIIDLYRDAYHLRSILLVGSQSVHTYAGRSCTLEYNEMTNAVLEYMTSNIYVNWHHLAIILLYVELQITPQRCYYGPGLCLETTLAQSHGGLNRHMLQWIWNLTTPNHRISMVHRHGSSKVCNKSYEKAVDVHNDYHTNNESACDYQDHSSVNTTVFNISDRC